MATTTLPMTKTSLRSATDLGYKTFTAGQFRFERDEYFAHIHFPGGRHIIAADAFLRSLMRDVAWGFFYGTVNFDNVFGTVNHYGTVEMFAHHGGGSIGELRSRDLAVVGVRTLELHGVDRLRPGTVSRIQG